MPEANSKLRKRQQGETKDENSESKDAEYANLINKATRGGSYLVLLQIFSRLFTFLLNLGLTRYMNDPGAFGVASVQLFLLYTVVLTLAREGVRRSCLRKSVKASRQSIINLTWWSFVAGILLTAFLCFGFIQYPDPEFLGKVPWDDYHTSVLLVGVSIVIELLSEPMFVIAQGQLQYRARAGIEAGSVMLRGFVTLLFGVLFDMHLLAFAYGHIAYGVSVLVLYWGFFTFQTKGITPESNLPETTAFHVERMGNFLPSNMLRIPDTDLRDDAIEGGSRTVLKLFLTEGARMAMVGMGSNSVEQGVYALVSNLGSLVARFAFQPIEEVAFTIFGKMNDRIKASGNTEDFHSVEQILFTLSKTMFIVGLVFVCFGTQYAHLLLRILYGEKWTQDTEAPQALGLYCVYVMVIGINGITEGFVEAVSDRTTRNAYKMWMVVCSVLYIASAVFLLRYGVQGLIAADCLNMSLRIGFSLWYIRRRCTGGSIRKLFPNLVLVGVFLAVLGMNAASSRVLYQETGHWANAAAHVAVGATGLLVVVGALLLTERDLIVQVRALVRSKGDDAKKSD